MGLSLASESLAACDGCEVAILNLGQGLLELLPRLDIVHMPLLMDHKLLGRDGRGEPHIPPAEVGLLSGHVRNQEHLEMARLMRAQCRVLIALGTCATHGGIPALANLYSDADLLDCCFRQGPSTDPAPDPRHPALPALLPRAYALDEVVEVDLMLPGCPPHPEQIALVLEAIMEGRQPELGGRSVCDTCPTQRQGKGQVRQARRFLEAPQGDPQAPLGEMRCLLEQGFLCLGPVTRAGCAGAQGQPPACLAARVPCRGCQGPVRANGNQALDMLNALASNGMDIKSVADRPGLLRFSGAHGRLLNPSRRQAAAPK